jgi:hypothetical protein
VDTTQVAELTPHPTAEVAQGQMQEVLTGHNQEPTLVIVILFGVGLIAIIAFFWMRSRRPN